MSEFFKAATRCDPSAADKAPIYVDRSAIMEEQFRAQRLVDQTMRTELLLREIEAEHAAAAVEAAMREAEGDSFSQHHGGGGSSAPAYRAPPQCTGHLNPSERHLGSRAIERSMNERANLWRQQLSDSRAAVAVQEGREAEHEGRQCVHRQKEAERELNALVVARQIAARESEMTRTRGVESAEMTKRRVHPIDVLHQRIAAELERDIADTSDALNEQLAIDAVPIERAYEDEQLRAIREFRRGPAYHIPDATNVAR